MIDFVKPTFSVSNYIAKPALLLVYKQYCPVAMINFPVAMDIMV